MKAKTEILSVYISAELNAFAKVAAREMWAV
jgi:hypothetical protein